jgi:tRNA-uridine 2-sulfurtransferase
MAGNKKAVALLSGGLDSTLAVKMMLEQGIDIVAVNFTSPFCNCTPKSAGCQHQASKVAAEFGIPIKVIAKGMDYMRIVEKPPHGHGRGMNPCVDCRIYILRKVKELLPELEASFVITGEVVGQRPMSQRRQQIELIEKESGLPGLILRPLSAQHFPPTVPEQEGIVNREQLLAISGRSRKPQIGLAEEMGIKDYPCPAGGCMLTDPPMAARLRDLFAHVPDYGMNDLQFLKVGRHFRLDAGQKIIVGKNEEENNKISSMAAVGATVYWPEDFRGPTAVARTDGKTPDDAAIGMIIAAYCREEHPHYQIRKRLCGGEETLFTVYEKYDLPKLESLRLGELS